MDFCNNYSILEVLLLIKRLILILTITVPIILLVMGIIDMVKSTVSPEEMKKNTMNLIKRSLSILAFFLVPTFILLLINLLGQNNTVLSSCAHNINPETIVELKRLESINDAKDNIIPDDPLNPTNPNPSSSSKSKLTVATWNIGRGNKVSNVTASKLARYIKEYGIDIIGIQEAKNRGTNLIKEIKKESNMIDYFFTNTPAGNAIISNKILTSKTASNLVSCGEQRSLQKIVLNINGMQISFYNTHLSYQSKCPGKQLKDILNKIKNDTNPTVLVGDFNVASNCSIISNNLSNKYLITAYDTMNSNIRCTDSIIISNNGKIKRISKKTIKTDKIVTDHNLVITTLEFN